jgi:hypothetical protein
MNAFRNSKAWLLLPAVLMFVLPAGAQTTDYANGSTVGQVLAIGSGEQIVRVGVTPAPVGTCSLYGFQFYFDPTKPMGKTMMPCF